MTTRPLSPTETAARAWLPAAAGAVAGTAAWTTRAAFDLVGGDGAPVRVAMLPPIGEAIGLVVAGALLAIAATRLFRRLVPEADRSRNRPDNDAVAPLFFSGILVVPYLPVLPDLWPAVTALAGPAKYVVWALTFAMIARAVWRQLVGDGRPRRELSTRASVALVAAVSCVTFATAAWRLVGTVFPGGDEPHYLVIAQSLWRDGDLRIENNHERGDTLEYYPRRLAPHYLTRGADGEIYSVHPIGLPVLATPIYALLGYRGVVGWLVLVAAAASTVAWWLAFAVSGSRRAATFAWAAATLTAPFVFNSFTVYPEVPASLLVVATYGLAAGLLGRRTGAWRWAACGVALAVLPWLSTKYVPMAGALGAVVLARLWWPGKQEAGATMRAAGIDRRWRKAVAVCAPPAISLIAWIAFFWTIWGHPWPSAPYGASSGTEARHLASGAPGLLLDQEYGLLAVAPVLWLALVGLASMVRERATRRTGLEVALVGLALLSTVGAFHLWWGGSAAVGRPLIATVPLLAIPLAWRVRERAGDRALQAGYLVVLALSLANVVVAATQSRGLLLASGRDGASKILEWWSPWWPVTGIAPSFIVDPPVLALGYTLVWLVPAWLVALGLRQLTLRGTGAAGLAALASTAAVAAAASIAAQPLLGSWMRPPARLEARTWSPLLNRFSPSRRPLAVEYRPFVRVAPDDVPRRFVFDARSDDDRPRPPVDLLHDARWTLPAGRYTLEVRAAPGVSAPEDSSLGLQLGRLGHPVERWAVVFDDRGRWTTSFVLPLDVGSVGFRASAPLAALEPTLAVRPVAVVDRRRAPPTREVLQVARYGASWVFFHTEDTYPEAGGFWTRAGRQTSVTVASPGEAPPRIVIRAGPVATGVTLVVAGRAERIRLEAGEARELDLPAGADGVWPVGIEADEPFVPAAFDPSSTDVRRLGCWVEIGEPPTE